MGLHVIAEAVLLVVLVVVLVVVMAGAAVMEVAVWTIFGAIEKDHNDEEEHALKRD